MPELPEVQTVVNQLKPILVNKKIHKVITYWYPVIRNIKATNFNAYILNNIIVDVFRKAKFIAIKFKSGFLLCHLRMTGQLFVKNEPPNNLKHIHIMFKLHNTQHLIFKDVRKFGGLYFYKNLNYVNAKLGIAPFEKEFNENKLVQIFKSRNRQVKALILDQSILTGMGNIYTDEALWNANIHPLSISSKISIKKIKLLYNYIMRILEDSIKHHGTSFKDFIFDNMKTGSYKEKLNVYGRNGLNCNRCNNIIIKIKVASRGTHICPHCQKK